jgi:outer membrane protein OmpA-like peptidoglycan-associated protein
VKAHLVAEGVAATRLLAVGYGATRPASDGERGDARIELTRAQ